jgi:hypothetical protein
MGYKQGSEGGEPINSPSSQQRARQSDWKGRAVDNRTKESVRVEHQAQVWLVCPLPEGGYDRERKSPMEEWPERTTQRSNCKTEGMR